MIRSVARSVRRAAGWPAPPARRLLEPRRMRMVGFDDIVVSTSHRRVSPTLARARTAFIAMRPLAPRSTVSYALGQEEGYEIGRAR